MNNEVMKGVLVVLVVAMVLAFVTPAQAQTKPTNETLEAGADKIVDDQFTERRNMNISAPNPKLYDFDAPGLSPLPDEGQILIDINAYTPNHDDLGWSGSIRYADGDTTSVQGSGRYNILLDCVDGNPYSVNFQMDSDLGTMRVSIMDYDANEPDTNMKMIDGGYTEAAYGIVGL